MTGDGDEPDWWDEAETADRADILVSNETERKYVRTEDGRGAWFDLRNPSWNKKKEVLSDCIEADASGSGSLELDRYYREMLEFMIADSSVDMENTATTIRGLSNHVGNQLEEEVPRPSARGIDEEEEGKSDGPSEGPEESGPPEEPTPS